MIRAGPEGRAPARVFAAIDLGTNNCRLLIATPSGDGFRIVDAFSRIVRLGEGLSATGRLSEAAMERALDALAVCAGKIARKSGCQVRAVATQACRVADNAAEFLERAAARTGLRLSVISAREEAELAVAGCSDLLDWTADAALVLDVGGGSSELSWIDLAAARTRPAGAPLVAASLSVPLGVVTLAEMFPEAPPGDARTWRAMVEAMKAGIADFDGAARFEAAFREGRAHLVGTSGAITSLAGLHLRLARYDRSRVDALWMSRSECDAVAERLAALTIAERGRQPCIGPDRADLVLAGAAILRAVQEAWPCDRVRVADRGLREGLLLALMAEARDRRRWRRR